MRLLEDFHRIVDALRFLDPAQSERSLLFDARVAEGSKLRAGTRVHIGALRLLLIAACDPIVQDAVRPRGPTLARSPTRAVSISDAVLLLRGSDVERLHAQAPGADVIFPSTQNVPATNPS